MDDNEKRDVVIDFFLVAGGGYKPPDDPAVDEFVQADRKAQFEALLSQESDAVGLAAIVYDIIGEWATLVEARAILKGYKASESLRKLETGEPEERAQAKIARILMRNPTATNMKICRKLGAAGIPLVRSKWTPQKALCWYEVSKLQYYRNFFSRARARVAKAKNLREWKQAVPLIHKFYRDGP